VYVIVSKPKTEGQKGRRARQSDTLQRAAIILKLKEAMVTVR